MGLDTCLVAPFDLETTSNLRRLDPALFVVIEVSFWNWTNSILQKLSSCCASGQQSLLAVESLVI